eukprot:scaffold10055_cov101-Isochrysis_galbana.AAC.3
MPGLKEFRLSMAQLLGSAQEQVWDPRAGSFAPAAKRTDTRQQAANVSSRPSPGAPHPLRPGGRWHPGGSRFARKA